MQLEIKIPQEIYDKIMHWVNKTDIEVSGFGKVVRDKETNTFTVVDAYLLPQEGGAAHTDIDEAGLARLMYQTREVPGDLRWWWHSHVKMGCFWSGTDTDTIKSLGKNGWLTATVFNQKYEMKSALAYVTHSDFGDDVDLYDDIETTIVRSLEDTLINKWDKEFDTNVKEKKYTTSMLSTTGTQPMLAEAGIMWTPDDQDGIMGWGVRNEAAALSMTPAAYCAVLNTRDRKAIDKLEERLIMLEEAGLFDDKVNYYGRGHAWS